MVVTELPPHPRHSKIPERAANRQAFEREQTWTSTFTFMGERGYLRVERPDRLVLHTDDVNVVNVEPTAVNSFVAELTNFRDVVLHGAKPFISAEEALLPTRLVEAAFASHREGKTIHL